jgi:hypothetical protein
MHRSIVLDANNLLPPFILGELDRRTKDESEVLLDLTGDAFPFRIALTLVGRGDVAGDERVDEWLEFVGEEGGRTGDEEGKGKNEVVEDEAEEGEFRCCLRLALLSQRRFGSWCRCCLRYSVDEAGFGKKRRSKDGKRSGRVEGGELFDELEGDEFAFEVVCTEGSKGERVVGGGFESGGEGGGVEAKVAGEGAGPERTVTSLWRVGGNGNE